jgi:hypothetical protein
MIHSTSPTRQKATILPLVDYKSSPVSSARRSLAPEVDDASSSPSPPHSDPLRRNPFLEYRCPDPALMPLRHTPSLVRDGVQTSTPVIAKSLPKLPYPLEPPSAKHGPATPTQPVSVTAPSAAAILFAAGDSDVEIIEVSPRTASAQAPSAARILSAADDSDLEIVEVPLIWVVLLSLDGLRVSKFIKHKDNGFMKLRFLCRKFKLPPAQGLYYRFGPKDDRNGMWVAVRDRGLNVPGNVETVYLGRMNEGRDKLNQAFEWEIAELLDSE